MSSKGTSTRMSLLSMHRWDMISLGGQSLVKSWQSTVLILGVREYAALLLWAEISFLCKAHAEQIQWFSHKDNYTPKEHLAMPTDVCNGCHDTGQATEIISALECRGPAPTTKINMIWNASSATLKTCGRKGQHVTSGRLSETDYSYAPNNL